MTEVQHTQTVTLLQEKPRTTHLALFTRPTCSEHLSSESNLNSICGPAAFFLVAVALVVGPIVYLLTCMEKTIAGFWSLQARVLQRLGTSPGTWVWVSHTVGAAFWSTALAPFVASKLAGSTSGVAPLVAQYYWLWLAEAYAVQIARACNLPGSLQDAAAVACKVLRLRVLAAALLAASSQRSIGAAGACGLLSLAAFAWLLNAAQFVEEKLVETNARARPVKLATA